MRRLQTGKCKMCLQSKALVSSHLIPQAMYDYCRVPHPLRSLQRVGIPDCSLRKFLKKARPNRALPCRRRRMALIPVWYPHSRRNHRSRSASRRMVTISFGVEKNWGGGTFLVLEVPVREITPPCDPQSLRSTVNKADPSQGESGIRRNRATRPKSLRLKILPLSY